MGARYKRPQDFDATIGGQEWRIVFVTKRKLPKALGMCHWEKRLIEVRYDQDPQDFLDTLIHEMLHATDLILYAAEPFVDRTGTEMASALIRAGFGR